MGDARNFGKWNREKEFRPLCRMPDRGRIDSEVRCAHPEFTRDVHPFVQISRDFIDDGVGADQIEREA